MAAAWIARARGRRSAGLEPRLLYILGVRERTDKLEAGCDRPLLRVAGAHCYWVCLNRPRARL